MIVNAKSRQAAFSKDYFRFLQECKKSGVKINQTEMANALGIKRSTFSTALNYGPSDTVLLRYCLFTGTKPEQIDTSLLLIEPLKLDIAA